MIADDLFAGAGGWDLAAEALGIHARGVENMEAARATRDAAGLTTIHDDVWTYKPRYIGREMQASGLIASPPCQTFSAAGKGAGRKALDDVLALIPQVPHMTLAELRAAADTLGGDERTALVLTPLWFAVHHPYRWLAWEQVPTVLPVWEACADALRACEWNVTTGLVHSEQYGVPQTRKRAVLIAHRTRAVALPAPTHSLYHLRNPEKLDEGVLPWVSMADALPELSGVDGMTAEVGRSLLRDGKKPMRPIGAPAFTVHGGAKDGEGGGIRHRWHMVSNYGSGGDASNRGVRTSDQPAPTITSKIDRNVIEFQRRNAGPGAERAPRSIHEPSYTIRASGSGSHPSGVQLEDAEGDKTRVTARQAGILQSFPADHPWQGTKGRQYLQVGNAVPPLMALHVLAEATGLALPVLTATEAVA